MESSSASIQTAQLNPSQPPSSANPSSSTGPQIRSRITVVCAECKRLKLKCDRKAPCGSCKKRDTVVRCIYSAAAVEKVDVPSLNNRLIQVEATLAMITAGQTPPVFQSIYPFSNAAANPTQSGYLPHHHQHHHHYAAPSQTPGHEAISLSHQDLASVWLDDLDLGVSWPSSSASTSLRQRALSNVGNSGYIKLESSPVDIELHHGIHNDADDLHMPYVPSRNGASGSSRPTLASRPSTPLKRNSHPRSQQQRYLTEQRNSAQRLLPALSIYYLPPAISAPGTSTISSAGFPDRPSASSSSSASPTAPSGFNGYNFAPQPQYTKPQVTPALLALLPPVPTCTRFLQSAMEVFHVRPLPFEPGNGNGWKAFEKKCMSLLGGGAGAVEKERREKEREKVREAKRMRQIYFGGIAGLQQSQSQDTELDDSGGGRNVNRGGIENIDEAGWPDDVHSLTFFAFMCAVLAVGASALTPATSEIATTESPAFFYAVAQQALGVWDTHSSSSGSAGTDEGERMDYLFACIVGVVYLMISGTGVAEGGEEAESGPVYALVGKMVNAARGMGLGRERSAPKKSKHSASASDRASASVLQAKGSSKKEKERLKEEWRKMVWWEILFYDLFTADALGHQPYIPAYSYTTTLPSCAEPVRSISGDDEEADSEAEDDEFEYEPGYERRQPRQASRESDDSYLGARYRLAQLAQTIKNRISHPDCCCGYTLDQAASLEDEIRRWQSDLPQSLTVPFDDAFAAQWGGSLEANRAARAQGYEFTMMANVLVLKVYTPFLRHGNSGNMPPTSRAGTPIGSPASMNSPASQSAVHAAQAIVRAAKAMQPLSTMSPNILPTMFDFYPLDKLVFDSVVICAHAAFTGKASTFGFDGGALVDDVSSGLSLLSGLPLTASGWVADTQKKVVEALYKRLVTRGMNLGVKRKHDQLEADTYGVPTAEYSSSSNGAAGGSNGEGMMSGFDFNPTNNNQTSQYLHNGIPVAQQQHSGPVDESPLIPPVSFTSAPPRGQTNGSASYEKQLQHRQDLGPSPTSAVQVQVSARDAEKGKETYEKDKKHPKKPAGYPPVGIRVRPGKDTRAFAGLGSGMQAPPPLMTSTPRPLPSADTVLAFQQQQKQKYATQASSNPSQAGDVSQESQQQQPASQIPSPPNTNGTQAQEAYRSRSSSLSHVQPQQHQHQHQQMEYPVPFGHGQTSDGADVHQRKRFAMQDNRKQQQQQQQHQVSPQPPPFAPHTFDQGQQRHSMYDQSPQGTFESTHAPSQGLDGLGYNAVSSSPFSNATGPISASGSPFTSESGHPSTPTFATNHHHHTPPVFGPSAPPAPAPPPSNSPATYFHNQNAFNGSYVNSPASSLNHHNHGQSMSLTDMGMDQSMISVPSTPVYDKSQHQVMDSLSQHHHMLQQRQHQVMESPYDGRDNQGQQMVVGMTVGSPWAPPSAPPQSSPAYWNNGSEFKFYQ